MPAHTTAESTASYVDVLVIGAGPAGLTAANGLARNGVNVRIVDKRPVSVAAGQADGLVPRTLEVLESYGLRERLFKEGTEVHLASFYNPGPNGIEVSQRAPFVTAPTTARWPFAIGRHQGAIENVFLDSLHSMQVEVERPVVPTSIEISTNQEELDDPQAYPIKVQLSHLDSTDFHEVKSETVYARFVVGADGARSWVRKTLDISLDGEQTQYIWGVLDILPDTDFPDVRTVAKIHSNNGSSLLIPREDDTIRLYIQIDETTNLIDDEGRLDRSSVTPDSLMEIARKTFQPYKMDMVGEPNWWTVYMIGQRVASRFSVEDRVFIVGDACHTHSPKAGQGMNASINDSHNLLWKLTHVLRGWSKMSLLKTYELERRKFAQDLIAFDKYFSKLFSAKAEHDDSEGAVQPGQLLEAWQTFSLFTSGIGIHYAPSAIVDTTHQDLATNLIIGQRMPPQIIICVADGRPVELQDLLPSDGRFKLFLFSGDVRDATQLALLHKYSEAIEGEKVFGKQVAGGEREKWLDVFTVSHTPLLATKYTDIPASLRSHWKKVLTDDSDVHQRMGGMAYSSYGIGAAGAAVVVRPDGYVGTVAPLDKPEVLDQYFRSAGLMA